ncbi:MAG: Ig-like domain-containing protein [Bacteroidales bacterium]|nr:Ig-like domain-containing protein [Bacteroidales bacterium]
MKKTIYNIFLASAAAVCLVSCMRTVEQEIPVPSASFPGDATVTLGFYAPCGPVTKADPTDMETEPFINSMHVFFFDEDGTHLVVRKATISSVVRENYDSLATNANTMLAYWTVDKVDMTIEKRILHFVANLPDDRVPKMGSESSVFRLLSVEYPRASYWQRIELENGIQPYAYDGTDKYSYIDATGVIHDNEDVPGTYDSSTRSYVDGRGATVNEGDYIDINGNKIINGTGYYFVPAAGSPLRQSIPLIRNFVKIKFINSWDKFSLRKVALVNTPKEGLVAPYRTPASATDPRFESAYLWSAGNWRPGYVPRQQDVSGNGYAPLLAAEGIDPNPVPAGMVFVSPPDTTATLFMYERGLPSVGDATSILVGGVVTVELGDPAPPRDSDGNTWFRMEITDADGEYYPFYRNFTYTLRLGGIEKPAVHGHASADDAISHVALGNISNASETETLTQVNDGDGLTLWVDYVDYTTVGGGETVALIYTLFYEDPDSGVKTYYCASPADRVTFTRKKNETTGSNLSWATESTVTKLGKIIQNDPTTGDYWNKRPSTDLDWYVATVQLRTSTSDILQNDIEVQGKTLSTDAVGYRRLTRLVTYTVTQRQKLTAEITPIGKNEAGRPTHLTVTLPNTLTRSAFPLSLRIEAEDNNITPLDNVVAKVGPSTFDGSVKNSYYFVKTIEYSEYRDLDTKAFTFDFTTTKSTSRSDGKVTRIKVTEDGSDWFLSDDANSTCYLICNEGVSVSGITLNKHVLWLKKPGTEQLTAHVDPWDASDLVYTWSIDDTGVATLDNGLVTAVDYGDATVTVTTHEGGFTDECIVHVYEPVTSITLSETALDIARGSTHTLTAVIAPSDATYKDVVWSSSHPDVASVDASTGEVTALSAGFTVITASATDGSGKTAVCNVNVYIPVDAIQLNKTQLTLKHNDTELLQATVSPSDASNKAVEWESSNTSVATVNANGIVTAVATSGTAIITARSVQNPAVTATCEVTAEPNYVSGIAINKSSTTISQNHTETLTATVMPANADNKAITWSSSDTAVATVDANGVVSALSPGSATITATSVDGGYTATCDVTVVFKPVTGITLSPSGKMLPVGDNFTLTAVVSPADASVQTVTWSSDNTSAATVADGVVTGVSKGVAHITATATDGSGVSSGSCEVTVYVPVSSVTIDQTGTQTLYLHLSNQLSATINPGNADVQSVVWSVTGAGGIVSVDASTGEITGLAAGNTEVTVTVTDVNGDFKSDSRNVTVTNVVTYNTTGTAFTNGPHVQGAVSLTLTGVRGHYNNYTEFANNGGFTLDGVSGTGAKIKSITINYVDNNHAAGTASAASGADGTGTVYASSGSTATWTATDSASPVTVTLRTKSGGVLGLTTYYPQITSIVVTYE